MSSANNPKVRWRKSSKCASGECIELAYLPSGRVALRSGGAIITCTQEEFAAFLAGAKVGEFDES